MNNLAQDNLPICTSFVLLCCWVGDGCSCLIERLFGVVQVVICELTLRSWCSIWSPVVALADSTLWWWWWDDVEDEVIEEVVVLLARFTGGVITSPGPLLLFLLSGAPWAVTWCFLRYHLFFTTLWQTSHSIPSPTVCTLTMCCFKLNELLKVFQQNGHRRGCMQRHLWRAGASGTEQKMALAHMFNLLPPNAPTQPQEHSCSVS